MDDRLPSTEDVTARPGGITPTFSPLTPDANSAPATAGHSPASSPLQYYLDSLHQPQNLALGILGGLLSAVGSVVLWGVITRMTRMQIGWMALAVGLFVGIAVRKFGRGIRLQFGLAGACLTLVGCLFGNVVSYAVAVAVNQQDSVWQVLEHFALHPAAIGAALGQTLSFRSVCYAVIAFLEGYNFSFRKVTDEELAGLLRHT